jgi:Leucine-rich repeat (LRR) protein
MKLKPFITLIVVLVVMPGALGAAPSPSQTSLAAPAATIRYVESGASGDCSTWANACELQTALSVAGAGDEIWVQKGVYKPTNGITYESCQDIHNAFPYADDGDYVIQTDSNAFQVFCFDMAGTPVEYLTLADPASNFAQYTAGGYSEPGTDVRTEYSRVRLLPDTLKIDIRDQRYVSSNGGSLKHGGSDIWVTSVYYGVAMDCRGDSSAQGVARIDLRGTPFTVDDPFMQCGWHPGGSATFSEGHQVVVLTGGGECGSVQPSPDCLPEPFNDTGGPQPILELGYLGPERHATFQLKNGVAIYGGFAGSETSRDDRDWLVHVTTLSGDLLDNDGPAFANNEDNSYHVVTGSGVDASAVLDGFTISGGNAWPDSGGGMYNSGGSPTLANLTFSGNTASAGGGMNNEGDSSPTLTGCKFSGNTAGVGGGMHNDVSSNPTLTNVTFSGNTASEGGGIYNSGSSSPMIRNSLFWGNTAANGPQIGNEAGSTPAFRYSDIQGSGGSASWNITLGTDGGGNLDVDPVFQDATNGDLHLRMDSPAIDAGDNGAVPPGVTTDLEGHPRFVDIPLRVDTGAGTAPIVDMGAYEVQLPAIFDCSAVTEIPFTECQALVALYMRTRGAGWADHSGWLMTDTPCSWYGVTCDMGHVRGLSLANQNLSGSIPPELGDLAFLLTLWLYGNQLSGTIPPELGNLANLQVLVLEENQLSGTIPPELGNLANLEWLWLWDNQLGGPLPQSLTNLQDVSLSINNELFCAPDNVAFSAWLAGIGLGGMIRACVDFDCSTVSEIPPSECEALVALFNYTGGPGWTNRSGWLTNSTPCSWQGVIECRGGHVVDLRLGNNNLRGGIPPELGNLTKLIKLVLGFNDNLVGGIPPEFGNLANLWSLELESTRLSGPLPQSLTNLHALSSIGLITEPDFCAPANAAFQAWLTRIKYTEHIPTCAGFDCSPVTEIPPSECQALAALYDTTYGPDWTNQGGWLATPGACSWDGVSCNPGHIGGLDLSSTGLKGRIPHELSTLSSLELLDVGDNPLAGALPRILTQLDLTTFDFSSSELCAPPDTEFQGWLDGIASLHGTGILCGPMAVDTEITIYPTWSSHVALNWTWHEPNTGYEVHRSVVPYFAPSPDTWVQTFEAEATLLNYWHFGAAADAANNYFYIVQSKFRDSANDLSVDSHPTGKFSYTLVPGN